MRLRRRQFFGLAAGALTHSAARAQDKRYVMKIVELPSTTRLIYSLKTTAPQSKKILEAALRRRSIRQANWARFRGRSKALSSAPSRLPIFHLSFLSASTNASKFWAPLDSLIPWNTDSVSPLIQRF